MKRKKNLIILVAVLAVLCVIIAIVYGTKKHIDKVQTVDEEIISTDPEQVSKISWTYQGKTLNFEKKDGTWYNTDDETFPVDQDALNDLLDHFESVNAGFVIEDVEDFDQYGLQSPECTITLSVNSASEDSTEDTGENKEIDISLGNYSTMDSKRYLTLGEGTVYLIDDDLEQYISEDKDTYLDKASVPSYDKIESFEIDSDDTLNVSYLPDEKHSYTQDYGYYAIDGDDYKVVSDANVNSLIDSIKNLDTSSYVTYNASEEDLTKYGFDDPAFTFTMTYVPASVTTNADGSTEQTGAQESKTYTVSFASTGKNNCYMHAQGSTVIFNVDPDSYDSIVATDYDTLRPSEILSLDWDKVKSIDLTIDDETYTITKKGDKYMFNDEEVDFDAVKSAIDALDVNEFNDEDDVKAEEIQFTVHYDDDDYATMTVGLYKYDGDNCVAKFNDETLGYVSRDLVDTLTEAVNKIVLG